MKCELMYLRVSLWDQIMQEAYWCQDSKRPCLSEHRLYKYGCHDKYSTVWPPSCFWWDMDLIKNLNYFFFFKWLAIIILICFKRDFVLVMFVLCLIDYCWLMGRPLMCRLWDENFSQLFKAHKWEMLASLFYNVQKGNSIVHMYIHSIDHSIHSKCTLSQMLTLHTEPWNR